MAPISRRVFLAAGAAAAIGRAQSPELNPFTIEKFVDPLPLLPVAKPLGGKPDRFRISMVEFTAKVHRDVPPTRMWGYNGICPGPVIETRRGHPVTIEWANSLPSKHFLPIDHNLHGAEKDIPEVRAVVHLHGAKTPPESDGYPESWYVPGKSATYTYPNDQEAAMLWYHDHAMGINRLNIYAGLFGLYIVRDEVEDSLNLPKGAYEVPLVICDRSYLRDGSLDYPVSGMPDMPWVPEAFGEIMVVNGKISPYFEVEPRRYRFRILNAANGRFFHLSLSNEQELIQIGTDQGLLSAPLRLKDFVIAPGERMDLIVDFAAHPGARIVLKSESFDLLQFRVSGGSVRDNSVIPAVLRPVPKTPESATVKTRRIPIFEYKTKGGDSTHMLLGGKHWMDPVTENPVQDTVEIWEFVNTTEDSHPIHLHLVRFQLLERRAFNEDWYFAKGQILFTGPPEPPEPHEAGWKDTIRAHSNMITRVIVRFEGYAGRYVWHCHVLEHEDNEMMRPYDVLPKLA